MVAYFELNAFLFKKSIRNTVVFKIGAITRFRSTETIFRKIVNKNLNQKDGNNDLYLLLLIY